MTTPPVPTDTGVPEIVVAGAPGKMVFVPTTTGAFGAIVTGVPPIGATTELPAFCDGELFEPALFGGEAPPAD